MEIKFGKVKPNNIFVKSSAAHTGGNFFEAPADFNLNTHTSSQGSRINDYDSTILENNAYQAISDEMLKIEHKMSVLENTLSRMNSEIAALQSLGASLQISDLKERKRKIEEELVELNKKYSELGLSARIAGQISSAFAFTANKKTKVFSKTKDFVSKKILAAVSKKISCSQSLKEALENLCSINLSVDELVTMRAPYGETDERYEKLTAYLNKANVIHSRISKNIDAITRKET
ncbi:MAG: hypothetical protein PHC64_08155 [Candidatus Gastranaerophilales bacterium]|nr:hypothetical protein [Candidatus Gastranaerophilales bacterium]